MPIIQNKKIHHKNSFKRYLMSDQTVYEGAQSVRAAQVKFESPGGGNKGK